MLDLTICVSPNEASNLLRPLALSTTFNAVLAKRVVAAVGFDGDDDERDGGLARPASD